MMYVQHVIEHQFHVVLIFILIHIYDTGSNFDHTSTQVIDSVAHPKNQTKSGLASCRKHPTTGYYRKSRSNLTPANHKMWSSSIQVPEKHPKTWGNWMKLGKPHLMPATFQLVANICITIPILLPGKLHPRYHDDEHFLG